ncbi:hypothetical protein AB205_0144710 [Aquarana catesbeiana]|uniref:Uncharacterized protein n=1 Tax=Aquarana catesbeiana TaxID=8400 RepID=A0A2G9RWC7_AQUCT|nr:hypothetical protein AB205_0144710 [Aquarana catesbeiana]
MFLYTVSSEKKLKKKIKLQLLLLIWYLKFKTSILPCLRAAFRVCVCENTASQHPFTSSSVHEALKDNFVIFTGTSRSGDVARETLLSGTPTPIPPPSLMPMVLCCVSEPIRRESGRAAAQCLNGHTELRLKCPHCKLLAVGALGRRERPGELKWDPRRGPRMLCAVVLHRAS